MGNDAVTSLMCGQIVLLLCETLPVTVIDAPDFPAELASNLTYLESLEGPIYRKADLVVAITFTVGILLGIFAFCQLGFVALYMSKHLVGGFTCSAACYVFASQLGALFGVKLKGCILHSK